ncbi:MAG: DUF547 domain-containing protein [Hydrogenophaga sp.]|nr:DUF547 domain-containing protein [Hydrogenophaga sp.]
MIRSTLQRRQLLAAVALSGCPLWWPFAHAQDGFDHDYAAWTALLKKHVRWLPGGHASQVDYRGFQADRGALKTVLDAMSAVPRSRFDAWSREQQMAFLINAYNAFTVELILTKYPDLKSIKELGSLLQSPWKKKFFTLLGEPRHLDWIEHEQLRPRYAEPRIHAAVNCASGMRRFLADRTRNRVANGRLEVSAIFKWFREDFEQGHLGLKRVEDLFARYALQLSDDAAVQAQLRERTLPVTHLDYDWALNGAGR